MKERQKRAKAKLALADAADQAAINLCVIAQGGTPCPWPPEDRGYIATAVDAEERLAAGEEQKQCVRCKLWRWKDEQEACDAKVKRSGS
jgi:hypothetical protein